MLLSNLIPSAIAAKHTVCFLDKDGNKVKTLPLTTKQQLKKDLHQSPECVSFVLLRNNKFTNALYLIADRAGQTNILNSKWLHTVVVSSDLTKISSDESNASAAADYLSVLFNDQSSAVHYNQPLADEYSHTR
ncbi:MAG: hypothetical protein LBU87_07080 [Lactobacillales bacterium]|jgi:hypothetical protein|nr:hypothetical protein [Lactobacillales bacterium]